MKKGRNKRKKEGRDGEREEGDRERETGWAGREGKEKTEVYRDFLKIYLATYEPLEDLF